MTPNDYLRRKKELFGMADATGKYVAGRVKSHRRKATPRKVESEPVDNPLTRGLTSKEI
jgi:hypothetical protein